eukprot:9452227-Prorocentrum_lima.AAC.1
MVERHHDVLRQAFLRLREQSKEDGLEFDAPILNMAVIAKHTMTTTGRHPPMQAMLGFQAGFPLDISGGV